MGAEKKYLDRMPTMVNPDDQSKCCCNLFELKQGIQILSVLNVVFGLMALMNFLHYFGITSGKFDSGRFKHKGKGAARHYWELLYVILLLSFVFAGLVAVKWLLKDNGETRKLQKCAWTILLVCSILSLNPI